MAPGRLNPFLLQRGDNLSLTPGRRLMHGLISAAPFFHAFGILGRPTGLRLSDPCAPHTSPVFDTRDPAWS